MAVKAKTKTKCKVLLLGHGNLRNTCRLEEEIIESSPVEKALGMTVDGKPNLSWQCVFTAQKADGILG